MSKIAVIDRIDLTEKQRCRLQKIAGSPANVYFFDHLENPKNIKEVLERIGDSEVVLTSWTDFPQELVLSLPPTVKCISVVATSYAWIDIEAARAKGIAVSNVPGYAKYSVSELVYAFILNWARKLNAVDQKMRRGQNDRSGLLGEELHGKTIGIIGLGSIGSQVAVIASAFGMNVLVHTLHPSSEREKKYKVKFVELNHLMSMSDVITVHLPFNKNTIGMIGKKEFAMVKKGAFLVYTSRPGVCDEEALLAALINKQLAGVALDEISESFYLNFEELYKLDNVFLSPEVGFYTNQAIERLTELSIDNICGFVDGSMINVVN